MNIESTNNIGQNNMEQWKLSSQPLTEQRETRHFNILDQWGKGGGLVLIFRLFCRRSKVRLETLSF